MITEGLILGLLASGALLLLGAKMKSLPVVFVSSLGWCISGLQVYQQTEEVLPMAMLMMIAFAQFFLIRERPN